jgi:SAM-dependent methyltransferase
MAKERDVADKCDFRIGDMRRIGDVLKGPERFDAVLIIFTSLGYYDEATDRKVLKQLQGLTKTGGILVLDMFNRDWMVRHFRPVDIIQKGEGLVMVEERRLNLENSRMEAVWSYYRKEDGDLRHLKTIKIDNRLYSLHELKRLVEGCGWEYRACYGGFDMRPYSMDTNRIILVAQKP